MCSSGYCLKKQEFQGTCFATEETWTTEINNCSQLQLIFLEPDKTYSLENNIDCTASNQWDYGKGFLPIDGFVGSIENPNNYVIDKLYINRPDEDEVAFFDSLGKTDISNLPGK